MVWHLQRVSENDTGFLSAASISSDREVYIILAQPYSPPPVVTRHYVVLFSEVDLFVMATVQVTMQSEFMCSFFAKFLL